MPCHSFLWRGRWLYGIDRYVFGANTSVLKRKLGLRRHIENYQRESSITTEAVPKSVVMGPVQPNRLGTELYKHFSLRLDAAGIRGK